VSPKAKSGPISSPRQACPECGRDTAVSVSTMDGWATMRPHLCNGKRRGLTRVAVR